MVSRQKTMFSISAELEKWWFVSFMFQMYNVVIEKIPAGFYFLSLEPSLPLLDFLNKQIDIDNLSQLVLNLSSFVQFYLNLQYSTKPAKMPPPGGTGGTGGFGFIKEKPDPWEVTSDVIPFPTDLTILDC